MLGTRFAVATAQIARKKHLAAPQNRIRRFADKQMCKLYPKISGGRLFAQEEKKLLILRGCVASDHISGGDLENRPPDREYDPPDIYYRYYQDKYAGPITEDTSEAHQSELDKAAEPEQYSALSQIIWNAESALEGCWLVPTALYEAVLSDNYGNYHRSTVLIAMPFLVPLLTLADLAAINSGGGH